MDLKKKIEKYIVSESKDTGHISNVQSIINGAMNASDLDKKRIKNTWNEVMSHVPEEDKQVAATYLLALCSTVWKVAENEGALNPKA